MAGRPSSYNIHIANKICEIIQNGGTLSKIAQLPDMPEKPTIYNWLKKYDEFFTLYQRAREIRADGRVEGIANVIDDMRKGIIDHNMARIELNAIQWQASKENPRDYGDKQQIDHSGTITLASLIENSFKKPLEAPNKVIDVTPDDTKV